MIYGFWINNLNQIIFEINSIQFQNILQNHLKIPSPIFIYNCTLLLLCFLCFGLQSWWTYAFWGVRGQKIHFWYFRNALTSFWPRNLRCLPFYMSSVTLTDLETAFSDPTWMMMTKILPFKVLSREPFLLVRIVWCHVAIIERFKV